MIRIALRRFFSSDPSPTARFVDSVSGTIKGL